MPVNGKKTAISTVVPVLIRVVDGDITVFPDPVTLYKDEELEWICSDGGFSCEFNGPSPFSKKKYSSSGKSVRVGPHHVTAGATATESKFKYTITADGADQPLDPTIEAEPRKRPK